jgi:uncharacterized membrane protein HdeD (DUF308 family)
MDLDVRIPIGLLFAILGVLLTLYGIATLGEPGARPTGLPVNVIWGIVLLVFGVGMLALVRRSRASAGRSDPRAPEAPQH